MSVVESLNSLTFKSNWISKIGSVEQWVVNETSLTVVTSGSSEWHLRSNSVSEVGFALSLETVGGTSSVVGEATSEGSEEAASFLVGLLKKHTIIIALYLNWSSILLLLGLHGLLLDELLLLYNGLLLNDFSVFGCGSGRKRAQI